MAENTISYGIGLSDQMINQMLQSDDPTIVNQAKEYVNKANEQQKQKSGFFQKLGNFLSMGQAGAAEPDDFEMFASMPSNQINSFNRPNIFDISGGGITTTPSAAMFLDDAGLPPIDTSYGSANEPDDYDDVERAKQLANNRGLLSLINPFAILGPAASFIGGGIRGGLKGLQNFNQGLRSTDFGRSRTLAEFFQKQRERKQAQKARGLNPEIYQRADELGFTNEKGGFSTDKADDAGTSLGSGQFSPQTSKGRSGY